MDRYLRRGTLVYPASGAIRSFVLTAACFAAVAASAETATDTPADLDLQLRQVLLDAVDDSSSFEDRFDAEVWLTVMSQRLARQVPNVNERLAILKTVHRHATLAQLQPELVLAVIDVESNFDRYAISSASALGLMQIMPFWVDELGYDDKNVLFNIDINILLGCRILKYYLDMEDGDMYQGLARYNGSTGRRWYGDRVLQRLSSKWFRM